MAKLTLVRRQRVGGSKPTFGRIQKVGGSPSLGNAKLSGVKLRRPRTLSTVLFFRPQSVQPDAVRLADSKSKRRRRKGTVWLIARPPRPMAVALISAERRPISDVPIALTEEPRIAQVLLQE